MTMLAAKRMLLLLLWLPAASPLQAQAPIALRARTDVRLAYSIWRLPDGTIIEQRQTQAEYDGGERDGWGKHKPNADAVLMLAGGGIPALDTADGWPAAGDAWIVESSDGPLLRIQTGPGLDEWSAGAKHYADKGNGKADVSGFQASSSGNILTLKASEYSGDARAPTLAKQVVGIALAAGFLTVDPSYPKRAYSTVSEESDFHRSIALADTSTGSTTTTSTVSFPHVATGAADEIVIASIGSRDGDAVPVSVLFNSKALTSGAAVANAGGVACVIYYRVAPDVGTLTLAATWTSAPTWKAMAGITLTGVHQSTPEDADQTATGANNSPTATITTATDGAGIIDCIGTNGSGAITMGAQTNRASTFEAENLAGDGAAMSTLITKAAAGAQVMDWTTTGGDSWAEAVWAAKDSGGGAAAPVCKRALLGVGC